MVNGRRAITLLMIAAFLTFFDRAQLPPLLNLIADDMRAPIDDIGNALTAYVIAYATAQLLWSAISSRIGRVRVLAFSTALGVLGNIIAAVAPDPFWLAVGRVVAGAGFGATVPTVLTFLGDNLELKPRAAAAANLAAALSLGLTVGTVASSFTGEWLHWRLIFAVAAASGAILVVFLLLVVEPASGPPQKMLPALGRVLRNRAALGVLVLAFVEGIILVGIVSYLPVAIEYSGESVATAGLIVALFGVAVIVTTPLVRFLISRWRPWILMLVGGLTAIAAYGLLTLIVDVPSAITATVLLGFCWACAHTQLQTWMTDVVSDARAVGMSLFAVAFFGGGSVGTAIGNVSAATGEFALLFGVAAILSVVFTAAASLARARYRTRES